MTAKFTHEEIISYLSSTGQEQYHFLIDLEHPYFFTAGSRLTLFADNDRWAIVFEKAGFSTGSACGMLELSYYGNCLRNTTEPNGQTSNSKYVTLIEYDDLQAITEPDGFEQVAANAIEIRVRDKIVPIQNDPSEYRAKGIDPTGYSDRPDLIEFEAMIRFLDETNPGLFRANETELRQSLPGDLPQLMVVDEWHHQYFFLYPEYTDPESWTYKAMGTPPGEYETYNMIADVLVARDPALWKPTLPPNNNWRNWPNAGYM